MTEPPLPGSPAEDIGKRLDKWATALEDAVAVLNNTLTEIKKITLKEDGHRE